MDELIKIDKCLEWTETVLTEPNNLNKETINCIEYFIELNVSSMLYSHPWRCRSVFDWVHRLGSVKDSFISKSLKFFKEVCSCSDSSDRDLTWKSLLVGTPRSKLVISVGFGLYWNANEGIREDFSIMNIYNN